MNWADYVYYDESSPTFLRWKIDIMWGVKYTKVLCAKDTPAGTRNSQGYYKVAVTPRGEGRVMNAVHHIVWWLNGGTIEEGNEIDHEDGDRSNNSLSKPSFR